MARGQGRRRKEQEADPPMAGEGEPSGNAGHNSEARAKIIRTAVGEMIRLKGEKASIQEMITEVRGQVKSLGIKAAEFNLALRYYELEVEDRNPALDHLRELFNALDMGGQLNFLDAVESKAPVEGAADGGGAGLTAAFGEEAGAAGKPSSDNPHPAGSASHGIWNSGWLRGQRKLANKMGPDGDAPAPAASERRPQSRSKGEQTPALV